MSPSKADAVEARLLAGNLKFTEKNKNELKKHLAGQSPMAAVLTCSDSRVPPELIFSVGLGEMFVVRVAGNVVLGATVIGSLEYAVQHLHVPLIVVMGHTCCGALKAAEAGPGDGSCVGDIVNEMRACFEGGDNLRANVRRQVAKLPERSKSIGAEVKAGRLKIKGAIYNLEDGKVEML